MEDRVALVEGMGSVGELSAAAKRFLARADALRTEPSTSYERRKLAYEVLRVYIRGQRAFVVVESRILARVRAGGDIDPLDRKEAVELTEQLGVLRDLMHAERAAQ